MTKEQHISPQKELIKVQMINTSHGFYRDGHSRCAWLTGEQQHRLNVFFKNLTEEST